MWTRLHQVRTTLREAGPRALAVKTLQELRLYRRLGLFEVPIEPDPPRVESAPAGITVRAPRAARADLEAYAALCPDGAPDATRARLERGDRCFVALLDGRLVSSVWLATGVVPVAYLDCDLELGPDEAYAYDAFTLPGLRGLDVGTWRTELMKDQARAAGRRRLLSLQLAENASQHRRSVRRGYRPLGVVGWYGIGPWRRLFVRLHATAPAGLAVALRRSRRATPRRDQSSQT